MGERFSEPVFDEGIAERATSDRLKTEYDVLASRAEQERREAEADPWIRTGDKNIVKADFFA